VLPATESDCHSHMNQSALDLEAGSRVCCNIRTPLCLFRRFEVRPIVVNKRGKILGHLICGFRFFETLGSRNMGICILEIYYLFPNLAAGYIDFYPAETCIAHRCFELKSQGLISEAPKVNASNFLFASKISWQPGICLSDSRSPNSTTIRKTRAVMAGCDNSSPIYY
jgi:hypothetical protein